MIRELISWLKAFFKPEKKPHLPQEPMTHNKTQAVIVVGHNEREQGAWNYLGETEFSFNRRIALKTQSRLASRGINLAVIERQAGISYSQQIKRVIKQVKQLSPELVISLHFNSFKKKAYGCEMLIASGVTKDHPSFALADIISDKLNKRLGLVERHQDGVKVVSRSHNGSALLYGLKDINVPSVLVEPVFANIETKESRIFFENEEIYIEILSSSIQEALK